jgi:hexosaminidase
MKQEGLASENLLQSYMTAKFAKMLEARGRVPIGWDEVLDGSEKFTLPNTLIVQSWRGMEGGEKASALGHKTIMSPNTAGC